jgi:hypothetical protein
MDLGRAKFGIAIPDDAIGEVVEGAVCPTTFSRKKRCDQYAGFVEYLPNAVISALLIGFFRHGHGGGG